MIISIQDHSEIPIYLQIRNQIVQGIADGRLKPGERLPAVRAFAQEIGINSMTVNKAYQMLKQEGYIYTDRRNGATIREDFQKERRLSEQNGQLLQQIIAEAKICGIGKEQFLELCAALYQDAADQGGC